MRVHFPREEGSGTRLPSAVIYIYVICSSHYKSHKGFILDQYFLLILLQVISISVEYYSGDS